MMLRLHMSSYLVRFCLVLNLAQNDASNSERVRGRWANSFSTGTRD
jgi:hypothetical protein